jgi:hypothetical protein
MLTTGIGGVTAGFGSALLEAMTTMTDCGKSGSQFVRAGGRPRALVPTSKRTIKKPSERGVAFGCQSVLSTTLQHRGELGRRGQRLLI